MSTFTCSLSLYTDSHSVHPRPVLAPNSFITRSVLQFCLSSRAVIAAASRESALMNGPDLIVVLFVRRAGYLLWGTHRCCCWSWRSVLYMRMRPSLVVCSSFIWCVVIRSNSMPGRRSSSGDTYRPLFIHSEWPDKSNQSILHTHTQWIRRSSLMNWVGWSSIMLG